MASKIKVDQIEGSYRFFDNYSYWSNINNRRWFISVNYWKWYTFKRRLPTVPVAKGGTGVHLALGTANQVVGC